MDPPNTTTGDLAGTEAARHLIDTPPLQPAAHSVRNPTRSVQTPNRGSHYEA